MANIARRLAGSYQRRALILLALVFVLDYGERTLVGAMGPTLKEVFGIGNFRLGLLSGAFLFVGALAAIPMGMLIDKVNRTVLMAGVFALWVVAVGLIGASVSFVMFLIVGLLVGAVSAVAGPALPSLVGDIVPAARRGQALGYVNTGVLIGLGIGFVIPVVVLAFVSWRWAFWLFAVAGAGLAFALWRLREPERTTSSGPSAGEQGESPVQRMVRERAVEPSRIAMLDQAPSEMSMWDAAKYTVRVRTDLIALVARSIGDFSLQGIAAFAVVFATGWYGISQSFADLLLLGVGIGALAGVLVEGRISDALLNRGRLNGRIWVGSLGYFLCIAAFYPAFFTHSLFLAIPLFAVGAFFLAGARPPLDAIRVDVLVPTLRGRSEAVRQVLRALAEGTAPVVIGGISAALGGGPKGLQLAFLFTLPALLLNGVIMLFGLRTYQPDVAAAIASSGEEQPSREEPESSSE